MARPSGTSRVTRPEDDDDRELPSARRRRPFAFWFVILGVFALLLATFASLIGALL